MSERDPTPTLLDPDVAAALNQMKAARKWLISALVMVGVAFVFLMAVVTADGFLRTGWLLVPLATSVVAVLGFGVHGGRLQKRAGRVLGAYSVADALARLSPEPRLALGLPQSWVWVGTVWFIAGLTPLIVGVPPAIAAHSLGAHPGHAVALDAKAWNPCAKCATHGVVVFRTNDGVLVSTSLTGLAQDNSYYRPGIGVVYDPKNPARAMALRDYADGRGTTATDLIGSGLAALALGVLTAVELRRRRVREFQTGRPGHAIAEVRLKTASRGYRTWRVRWQDGRKAVYVNSKNTTTVLSRLLATDGAGVTLGAKEAELLRPTQG